MIYAEKLSFGFPQKELFHNISFTLNENRHCALIGSNGAGKTSLINLLLHPERFTYEGKLRFDSVGRTGCVTQFAAREGDQHITVTSYLSEDFLLLQERIAAVCAQMEDPEQLESALEHYQQLLDESDSMDADSYELNIRRQLQLAALEDKAELPLEKLSGGELKLVQIIRQMLRRPGLLVMDEPDVFLDFENLDGLRQLINAYKGTLLVVTHSRYLLGHCFDQIWHLENGDLQEFEGSFAAYHYSLLQKKIDLQLAAAASAAEIQRTTEMVERLRDEATEVAEAQKGRTLKQKVSYLNRLLAQQIKAPFVELRQPEITLPELPPAPEPAELLRVTDYTLAFQETLLEHVSFAVHAGEKVALVGPNGTGKTSLLRDIQRNASPAIHFSAEACPAFFSQLHAETLHEENTIYQELEDLTLADRTAIEAHLAKYCFDPDSLHRQVRHLSGGEKNLLQLAKLSLSGANLLLLDEPSSHLDTFAQLALEDALSAYQGAVLMVSHDFYSIAACADTILYAENGTLRPMSGRAFRKMIYKRHFSRDYLELEAQRKDLETRIARCLERGETAEAQVLCDRLGLVVEQMEP